jgi:hypothetical protein
LATGALPVLGPPFQVGAPAKLICACVDGVLQGGPVSEQRLVRHFEDHIIALGSAGQQPRGDQCLNHPPLSIGQRTAPHPPAGRLIRRSSRTSAASTAPVRERPRARRRPCRLGGSAPRRPRRCAGKRRRSTPHPTRRPDIVPATRTPAAEAHHRATSLGRHPLRQGRRVEGQPRASGQLLDYLDQRRATQRPHCDRITKQPSARFHAWLGRFDEEHNGGRH